MVNECHDRSIDTVNKIKELVTDSEVVNHKYGLKGTVTNKTTCVLLWQFNTGNTTWMGDLWEKRSILQFDECSSKYSKA